MRRALQQRALRDSATIVSLVLLSFTVSSCHRKQVAVPLPPQPEPATAVEAPERQPAAPVALPSSVAAPPPPVVPAPAIKDETKYQKNKLPEQSPPPKRTARPSSAPPTVLAAPVPVPANDPAVESPRLGDVLTTEQQHQYNVAIEQSLAHAQSSLTAVTNRQLTKEQEATVAQVQNFIQQALEKKKDELSAAKSLAERAEVLAHDLAASLR